MQNIELSESVECASWLDQESFSQILIDERNRSDRSGRSLILFLVTVQSQGHSDDLEKIDHMRVAKMLTALKTEIDRVGWCETGRTMGLLAVDIDPVDAALACERLKEGWIEALSREAGESADQGMSVQLRLYPEPGMTNCKETDGTDPYLYPIVSTYSEGAGPTHRLKRGMDIVLSALLLITLSPLFAILAMMVKLSSRGPVFFRQERVGHKMKPFVMYKFRTMYVDVDHQVHHDYVSWFITSSNNDTNTGGKAVFKLTNDPRITPIGGVLRRTSLDEFPQLWNVLIGDMSLVGPRPALPYEVEQYQPWHRGRIMEAKPGITGLWQVVGRSRTTFDEMVRLDLRYARSMSVWFDLMILLATPGAMISGKGAR